MAQQVRRVFVVTRTDYSKRVRAVDLRGTRIDSVWTKREDAEKRAKEVTTPYDERRDFSTYSEGSVRVGVVEPQYTDKGTTFSEYDGDRMERGNLEVTQELRDAVVLDREFYYRSEDERDKVDRTLTRTMDFIREQFGQEKVNELLKGEEVTT